MKYLRTAVLGAVLAQATQSFAVGNDGIQLTGTLFSENSCAIRMHRHEFDLGKVDYQHLKANEPTALSQDSAQVIVECLQDTPVALKFRTAGPRPVIDGVYHGMSLAETGTGVKKVIAYADLELGLYGNDRAALTGHLDDPLVLTSDLSTIGGISMDWPIHGDPDSALEPERSGITFIYPQGLVIRKAKFFAANIIFKAYAAPTSRWADAVPDVSSIPLAGSVTVSAVYL